jgi:hypothetical protein
VQGDHRLGPEPLAQRMLGGQLPQLGDDTAAPAQPQLRIDPALLSLCPRAGRKAAPHGRDRRGSPEPADGLVVVPAFTDR